MKLFNTIQELWDHCKYCPICTRNCRNIIVKVGPDFSFTLISYEKKDKDLILSCTHKRKGSAYNIVYNVDYTVDCIENSFTVSNPKLVGSDKEAVVAPNLIKDVYFYFYIESHCPECDNASSSSLDLEPDLDIKKFSNIGIERENFYLLESNDKFHVTFSYDRNVMMVSHLYPTVTDGGFTTSKTIELPIVKLDFSNQEKSANKLKTLILFS